MHKPITIFLYFINWNDSFYLPFIHKHYGSFCDRIIMYDNHSTDNSVELAQSYGWEIRTFGKKGVLDDGEYLKIKNNHWKEARGEADYVIVCDVDEFLYHKNIKKMLSVCKEKGITLPSIYGYDMYSEHLPAKSIFELIHGVRSKKYSKNIIFDPSAIQEINYNIGAHFIKPKGKIRRGGFFKMLHYRNIGGVKQTLLRHEIYRKRLSDYNIKNRYGKEYLWEQDNVTKKWMKDYLRGKEINLDKYPFSIRSFLRRIWSQQ